MTEEQTEKISNCRKEITKILAAAKSGDSLDDGLYDLIPRLESIQADLMDVLGEED